MRERERGTPAFFYTDVALGMNVAGVLEYPCCNGLEVRWVSFAGCWWNEVRCCDIIDVRVISALQGMTVNVA